MGSGPKRMRRFLRLLGVAALLTPTIYHPLCDAVFRCGCAWFFAGGATLCNIHNAAPPHCPACSGLGAVMAFGILVAAALMPALWLLSTVVGRPGVAQGTRDGSSWPS